MTSPTSVTKPLMRAVTQRDLPNPARIAASEIERYRNEAKHLDAACKQRDHQIASLRARVRELENDLQDATFEGSER